MDEQYLDQIHIRDLMVRCIVGIFPAERISRQDILINVTMYADLYEPCNSDRIEDTINYKQIKQQIMEATEHSEFFLIERMAEEIARICLDHPAVEQVRVSVDKPGALRFARSVAIEILRRREPNA